MNQVRSQYGVRAFAALGFIALAAGPAHAAYPEHPVRLVMPSPPGGGTDTAWRRITPKLGEILGQQIVVDNRGGASGNIGAEIVARATPDGYTLLACIASHAINPLIMKQVSYDLDRDFVPVTLAVVVPNILVSHPSLPAHNTQELIAYVKARPGRVQYASAGLGSTPHLMMLLFANMAGLDMIHVPYKGAAPGLTDVIAGHVPLIASNILSTLPHVKAGRVRAYGVTSAKRSSAAPDIPTLAEGGLAGYEAVQWFGLLAPTGTPRAIVMQLHAAVTRALRDPVVQQRFVEDGADVTPSASPEEFRAYIRAETKKWAKVVKDTGLRAE